MLEHLMVILEKLKIENCEEVKNALRNYFEAHRYIFRLEEDQRTVQVTMHGRRDPVERLSDFVYYD